MSKKPFYAPIVNSRRISHNAYKYSPIINEYEIKDCGNVILNFNHGHYGMSKTCSTY